MCILNVCFMNEMFTNNSAPFSCFQRWCIHHAIVSIKTFRINAPKYYDFINPYVVFSVLHISTVSKSNLRKLSYEITCIGNAFLKCNQPK